MSTDLTNIFGNDINVFDGNREADREFTGFAGSHGLTSMLLGSRGADIIVRGCVRASTRALAAAAIKAIEDAQWLPEDDYTFQNDTYMSIVWNKVEKIPNASGQVYLFNSAGEFVVQFIATGRMLI